MDDPASRVAALEEAVRLAAGRLGPEVEEPAVEVLGRARERLALSGDYTVVALAGATGSGKSSLMNALVGREVARPGVMRPTTGRPLAVVLPPPTAEAPVPPGDGTVPGQGRPTTGVANGSGPHDLLDWLDVADRHVVTADDVPVAERRASRWWRRARTASLVAPPRAAGSHGATTRADAPLGETWSGDAVRARGEDGDGGDPAPALAGPRLPTGAVLLDLPDHDSVVAEHRAIAERLYARADLLVWVVDPQKYADAALHVRYLRPLAGHASVLVLALNQTDRLAPREVDAVVADVRRIAAQDGLRDVTVLPVSAATGEGVEALRAYLVEASRRRAAATQRVLADVRAAGAVLRDACGTAGAPGAPERSVQRLVDALEVAAGVPLVVDAVRRSALREARASTGWPVTRWIGRLRADPLRRLGLGRPDPGRLVTRLPGVRGASAAPDDARDDVAAARRSSIPHPPTTTGALVSLAVRDYLDEATAGAPDAWTLAAREAVDRDALPDALDRAVVATAPAGSRDPRWWRVVGAVQWALVGVAGVGLLWLGVLAGLAYLRLPEPPTPTWGEVPWPTVLTVGGGLLGVLLALVSRVLAGIGARRRAGRVRQRLRVGVREVARRLVVSPTVDELAAWSACREAAARAAA
ncbi:GTP-binding protein HSR1 [Cellulomonas biazotea]|uniref:GTP-binding protein HSR1 n=1 Tax=Cellulomonas biazotea TaxID=1709 RepID=UPI0035E99A59